LGTITASEVVPVIEARRSAGTSGHVPEEASAG
ncbi:MAG: hypothetical protein JWP82_1465, partial [Humibacillus sp.]|nr:hypothetical protein [Humibacillus sp.]